MASTFGAERFAPVECSSVEEITKHLGISQVPTMPEQA